MLFTDILARERLESKLNSGKAENNACCASAKWLILPLCFLHTAELPKSPMFHVKHRG